MKSHYAFMLIRIIKNIQTVISSVLTGFVDSISFKKKIISCIVLSISSLMICVNAQTASFTSSVAVSCLPASIKFTDTSTGATTWNWDFGNNNTSTIQNPSVNYVLPGVYTVTLTINKGQASQHSSSKSITINPSPLVNPVPNILLGCEPYTGTYTADARSQVVAPFSIGMSNVGGITGASITSYSWDFAGAGNLPVVTQASPVLNLSNVPAGSYSFLLTVTDANGCQSSVYYSDAIIITSKPVADFTISKVDDCSPGVVNFTNKSTLSNGNISTYAWDVNNDGVIEGTTKDFSYTFTTPGTYDVALTVVSEKGCSSDKKLLSLTYNANNTVDFTTGVLCSGSLLNFFDNSSPNVTKWSWDFNNDGVEDSNIKNPSFLFPTAGNKTVKLTATFTDGCVKSVSKTLTLLSVTPSFTFDVSNACPPNYNVSFNSSASTTSAGTTITAYDWDYNNDGVFEDSSPNPSHSFNGTGSFPVTLKVTNSNGCTSILKKDVVLTPAAVDFITNRVDGCTPLSINFTTQYTNLADPIINYNWDFGDPTSGVNNTSALKNPSHVYTKAGEYDVTLIVTTTRGCVLKQMKQKYIKAGDPPVISLITYTQLDFCQRNPVKFIATITKDIDKMDWDFGDGSPIESHSLDSVLKDSIIHKYLKAGVMTVKVNAWSKGCMSTTAYTVTPDVVINEPIADFTPSSLLECTVPSSSISFTNKTSGDPLVTLWDWSFGDGNTSTLQNPSNTFAAAGSYKVKLQATNTVTGCKSDTIYTVFVCTSDPKFSVNNASPCASTTDSIQFTNDVIANSLPKPGFVVSSYLWDFGDGKTSTKANPKHAYSIPGQYTVKLKVTEVHGGCATFEHIENNMITVRGPIIDFSVDQGQICVGSTVNFTNKTKHDPSDTVDPTKDVYLWTFGDGQTSTVENPSHTYNSSGNYTVVLKVTDANNCFNTKSYTNSVVVPAVKAGYTSTRTVYCLDTINAIQFTNASVGTISKYDWDLDGDSIFEVVGGAASQSKIYKTVGSYKVRQRVTSNLGCEDVFTQTIAVVDGNAGFSLTNPQLGCAPTDAFFKSKDLATSVQSYSWSFGDGLSSNQANPQHRYLRRGDYKVKLTETLTGGCIKIDSMTIHVPGAYGEFSYDATPGCVPHTETFHIDNMQSVDSIKLNFGDGFSYTQKVTAGQTSVVVNHTYISAGSSSPILILKDSICGDYSFYDFSKIINTSTAPLPGFTTNAVQGQVCMNSIVQFTDTSKVTDNRYQLSKWDWDFGDGTAHSNLKNPTHTYTAVGSYTVTLKVGNGFVAGGCDSIATTKLQVNPIPTVTTTIPSQTVVTGMNTLSIPLEANLIGTTLSWTRTNPAGITTNAPLSATNLPLKSEIASAVFNNTTNAPITISYTVLPTAGLPTSCTGAPLQIDLIVLSNKLPITSDDTASVLQNHTLNGTVALNDNPSIDGGNIWSVASQPLHGNVVVNADGSYTYTPVANYRGTDSFTYYCSDINGDKSMSTVIITIIPVPSILKTASSVKSNNDGTYTLVYNLTVINDTQLKIDSIQVVDNLEDVFRLSGCDYKVTNIVASGSLVANGLYDGKSIIATLLPGKSFDKAQRDSIQIELLIDPHGKNDSILLSNQAILNCNSNIGKLSLFSDANLMTSPKEPTLSVVPKTTLFLPDAFSPNKDGINETFFIQHSETVTLDMEVFNRWGNIVFQRKDYQNDWDGRGEGAFFGQELPSGTYFITYKTYSKATGAVIDSGIKYITLRR
jgi:gliding motility-associated-like protein